MRGPVAVTAWCEKETKEFVAGVEVVYKDEVEGEDRLRFDGERQLLYFDAYELAERIMMHHGSGGKHGFAFGNAGRNGQD